MSDNKHEGPKVLDLNKEKAKMEGIYTPSDIIEMIKQLTDNDLIKDLVILYVDNDGDLVTITTDMVNTELIGLLEMSKHNILLSSMLPELE